MLDSFTRQNVIGRLRVAGTNVDALSARLRATMLLDAANLEAAQPTPSAIVFIRKIRDPLPGVLRLDTSATEPPVEWKTALAGALRSVAARAGRPAIEAVSGNEDAIIFTDRAELLACLAADTCHGATATRWWWSCLLRAGHDLPAIAKIWRESPEYIPSALDHLSKRRVATAFVQRLDGDTVHQFVQAITQVFGLRWLMPVVASRMDAIGSVGFVSSSVSAIATEEVPNDPPWRAQASETVMHHLSLDQQRFLGIALMIQRTPAVVRARAFARAVEQWQEQFVASVENQLRATRLQVDHPPSVQQTVSVTLPDIHTSTREAVQIDEVDEARIRTPKPRAVETVISPITTAQLKFISPEVVTGPPPQSAHAIIDIPQSVPDGPNAPPAVASLTTADLTDSSTIAVRELADDAITISIETDLGGLFYLINLGVYLNLYSDFTAPLEPGIDLNIWDFVTLVGSELLEGTHPDDPIWTALANLAGRDETQSVLGQRQPDPTVDHWLSILMPNVRARLRVALALKSDDEIPDILCRHHARVRITDTHIDVYFGLAHLPLAIRFAGLDRDPGWVPAAGRFISFHFD